MLSTKHQTRHPNHHNRNVPLYPSFANHFLQIKLQLSIKYKTNKSGIATSFLSSIWSKIYILSTHIKYPNRNKRIIPVSIPHKTIQLRISSIPKKTAVAFYPIQAVQQSCCRQANSSLQYILFVYRIRDWQTVTTLCTTTSQHLATIGSLHSLTESVLVNSLPVWRLVCSFHCCIFFCFYYFKFGVQK